jgi:hypothetical protein
MTGSSVSLRTARPLLDRAGVLSAQSAVYCVELIPSDVAGSVTLTAGRGQRALDMRYGNSVDVEIPVLNAPVIDGGSRSTRWFSVGVERGR